MNGPLTHASSMDGAVVADLVVCEGLILADKGQYCDQDW